MKIIKLSAIGSTNDYLKEISKKMTLEDYTVVVAESQTNGRGQVGTSWYSEPGKSLMFSVFKRFNDLLTQHQPKVNFAAALGIKDALEHFGITSLSIKWPNDIMAGSKKIGGILIENRVQHDSLMSSVIGVGLNVNNHDFQDLPQASSLLLSSGKELIMEDVLLKCLQEICKRLENIEAIPFSSLHREFENVLFKKDMVSVFENTVGDQFNAFVRGVSDTNELILELEDDVVQKFQLKEIKMRF